MSIIVDRLSIVEYDPHWPKQFETDSKKIAKLLGGLLISLDHIGGTSIPGLASTERIDFLAQVSSIEQCKSLIPILQEAGFVEDENHFSLRSLSFVKKQPHPPLVLWIYEHRDPQAQKLLNFRNYMRSEKKVTSFFSRAKKNLTDQYRGNLHEYLQHRSALFSAIDIKALKYAQSSSEKMPVNRLFYPSTKEGLDDLCLDNFFFFLHWPWLYSQKAHAIRSSYLSYTISQDFETDPCKELNTIFGVSERNSSITLAIEELRNLFHPSQNPCTWWVTPRDKPEDLFRKIHKEGFTYQETAHLLSLHLKEAGQLPQAQLEGSHIKSLSSAQEMISYCSTLYCDQLSSIARGPLPQDIAKGLDDKPVKVLNALASIHEKAYGYGQPIEFLTLSISGQTVASTTLVYYAGCVGFYNWSYLPGHESSFINLLLSQIQRCFQQDWKQFVIFCSEEMAPTFLKVGFTPTHPIHRHLLQA